MLEYSLRKEKKEVHSRFHDFLTLRRSLHPFPASSLLEHFIKKNLFSSLFPYKQNICTFFFLIQKRKKEKLWKKERKKNKFKPERRKKERKTSLRVLNEIEEKTFLADRVSSWPWRGLHWLAIWSMVESNGGIEMWWMRVQKNKHGSKSRNQTNLSP